jgi:hypothetical protein
MLGSSTAVSPISAATANIESKVNAYGSKQRPPFCFHSPIHISVTNREYYSTLRHSLTKIARRKPRKRSSSAPRWHAGLLNRSAPTTTAWPTISLATRPAARPAAAAAAASNLVSAIAEFDAIETIAPMTIAFPILKIFRIYLP